MLCGNGNYNWIIILIIIILLGGCGGNGYSCGGCVGYGNNNGCGCN